MNLLEQNLAGLKPGTLVRLTQRNGQSIEGMILQNDGESAISLQILRTVVVSYDQIGILETTGCAAGVQLSAPTLAVPHPTETITAPIVLPLAQTVLPTAEQPVVPPPPAEPLSTEVTDSDLKAALEALSSEAQKQLRPCYDSYMHGMKNHDEDKKKTAVDTAWQRAGEPEFVHDDSVNYFLGKLLAHYGDYDYAALSFAMAHDLRTAYLTAYRHAGETSDSEEAAEFYKSSAAYSSIWLGSRTTAKSIAVVQEAADVLRVSSLKCRDLYGFRLLAQIALPIEVEAAVVNAAARLCADCGIALTGERTILRCIEIVKGLFRNNTIHAVAERLNYPAEDFYSPQPEKAASAVSESIAEKTAPAQTDTPPAPTEESKPVIGEQEGWLTGKITAYHYLREKGEIQADDGSGEVQTYIYELKEIGDTKTVNTLKKSAGKLNSTINVRFKVFRKSGKDYAVSITPFSPKKPEAVLTPFQLAKQALSKKQYKEAVQILRGLLEGSTPSQDAKQTELLITMTCQCYNSMMKTSMECAKEATKVAQRYADEFPQSVAVQEAAQQVFMRTKNYQGALDTLNRLIEINGASEDMNRMLHLLTLKALCYNELGDRSSAVSQILAWVDIVERGRMIERYRERDDTKYPELAELYYALGDYEKSEVYAEKSAKSDRKTAILAKLAELKAEKEPLDPEPEPADEPPAAANSLADAYAAYQDTGTLADLNLTDADITAHVQTFPRSQLHCVLTYLAAAADLAGTLDPFKESAVSDIQTMPDGIRTVSEAFGYAFDSPLCSKPAIGQYLKTLYENSNVFLPEINGKLFMAAVLRLLFRQDGTVDYTMQELFHAFSESPAAQEFPQAIRAAELMLNFYNATGCGLDAFAPYKSSDAAAKKVVEDAKACREALDLRMTAYENMGRVRRLRELIFISEDSELRRCLNIAADNQTGQIEYVRTTLKRLFTRNDTEPSMQNIDQRKIDSYVDEHWDITLDIVRRDKHYVADPLEKFKSHKRTGFIHTLRDTLECIINWLDVAESSEETQNLYFRSQADALIPQLIDTLQAFRCQCEALDVVNSFNWGNEALRLTAAELLSKLESTYDPLKRKYLFIDFLRSGEVLLDDSYLPVLAPTFCDLPGFDILTRIDRHAAGEHPTFEARMQEIFGEENAKNNYHSAELLRDYGAETGLTELSEHPVLQYLQDSLKSGRTRLAAMREKFRGDLNAYESYGCISDTSGVKTRYFSMLDAWYDICLLTQDFGFYSLMLEAIDKQITVESSVTSERLSRQLADLAANDTYDFGVYPQERIQAFIDRRHFAVAENMMNCIRRGDIDVIPDYSLEPFSYFNDFVSEYATNYRAVYRMSVGSLEQSILQYANRRDIQRALSDLTGNVRKDVRGGSYLITHWSNGNSTTGKIESLLSGLGFSDITATEEQGAESGLESYIVMRKKRTGKVSYPHPIPAFGSLSESEGFRTICLYGTFDCKRLMDTFRKINTAAIHTLVLLNFAMSIEERRLLARKIKEEKSFEKSFIVLDRVLLFYLAKHYAATEVNRMLMAVSMPFAYYQPFVESSTANMPPELFTGREQELVRIESANGANLVYGGRQLGKSALLKMAQRNIDGNSNGGRAVLVEIKDLDHARAADLVSRKLILAGILGEECRTSDWDDLASHIEKRLMDDNPQTQIKYLLLMLDEADAFIESCKEIDHRPISAMKNLPADRFKLVMAGLHNLSRFDRDTLLHRNSILAHLSSVVVRPFKRPEAVKLLTNTLAYMGFHFQESVISLILAKTNYFPGLIQFYCQKLLEAMQNDDYAGYNQTTTPSYEVSEEHIKRVLSDPEFMDMINRKLESTLFVEEEGKSYYHAIALNLSFLYYTKSQDGGYTAEEIIQAAGDNGTARLSVLKREQFDELLQEMWDLNIVSCEKTTDGTARYTFSTEAFREMLGSLNDIEQRLSEYITEGDAPA